MVAGIGSAIAKDGLGVFAYIHLILRLHDFQSPLYGCTNINSCMTDFAAAKVACRSYRTNGVLVIGCVPARTICSFNMCRCSNIRSWKDSDRWLTAAQDVQLADGQKQNFMQLRLACLEKLKE